MAQLLLGAYGTRRSKKYGTVSLLKAVITGQVAMVRLLLAAGINVNALVSTSCLVEKREHSQIQFQNDVTALEIAIEKQKPFYGWTSARRWSRSKYHYERGFSF